MSHDAVPEHNPVGQGLLRCERGLHPLAFIRSAEGVSGIRRARFYVLPRIGRTLSQEDRDGCCRESRRWQCRYGSSFGQTRTSSGAASPKRRVVRRCQQPSRRGTHFMEWTSEFVDGLSLSPSATLRSIRGTRADRPTYWCLGRQIVQSYIITFRFDPQLPPERG